MRSSVRPLTVTVVPPVAPANPALTNDVPSFAASPVTIPAPLTVATAGLAEVHVIVGAFDTSNAEPSSNVAVADSWIDEPRVVVGLAGVTVSDTTSRSTTVTSDVPTTTSPLHV